MKLLAFIACASVTIACGSRSPPARSAADTAGVNRDITALSNSGVEAWNRGDLDAYLAPYADSVVIVTASGPLTNKAQLRELMQGQQAWGGRPLREARLRGSRLRWLDSSHVVQTAEVVLQGGDQPDAQSWLTAVWAHTAAGWRVIHEQSF